MVCAWERKLSGTRWKKMVEENQECGRKRKKHKGKNTKSHDVLKVKGIITERVCHCAKLSSRLFLASLIKFTLLVLRVSFWNTDSGLQLCLPIPTDICSLGLTWLQVPPAIHKPGFTCVSDLFLFLVPSLRDQTLYFSFKYPESTNYRIL